jgi:titin
MADTPATPCVYGGGALVYDMSANLFALRGNSQPDFWSYSIGGNSWSVITGAPDAVTYGGALVYKAAPYYTSGNLISSAWDTGCRSDFQNITWTSATPAGTALKFQIATNSDNATWNFLGPDGTSGTYYTASGTAIWSGHDGGRFIKYKAYFTTTDTRYTPVLNDISITYIKLIVTPSAITNAAASVEETTATLSGQVGDDGGEACQYRFQYGTASGVYTTNTTWAGSVNTNNAFSFAASGLSQGTKYYYRAQLQNSAGSGNGTELAFLTKPEAPASLIASVISGSQIDLSWTKGTGAVRTKVMRQTGGYPANYNDGTPVYFDAGTSVSDTGLTPGTTYYYRAWSEVTNGSLQQWSDNYVSASAVTFTAPSVNTVAATSVNGTTATLNGLLVNDGGQACQYSFEWGTTSGIYTDNISWTGSLTTGQTFHTELSGLAKGQIYYYRAKVKNSAGIVNGGELKFLTVPDAPVSFTALVAGGTELDLSWTKGAGADRTFIVRKTGSYPSSRTDGTQVYFDTGTGFSDTGLVPDTTYYYRAWSEVTGDGLQQWSDNPQSVSAATSNSPSASTEDASLVADTAATFHGSVISDGGEACQYRFQYGISPGDYTMNTDWTGAVHTGNSFSADISGLTPGTVYYYRAQLKDSVGTGSGEEVCFLTKPDAPDSFMAAVESDTEIDLNWVKGAGAVNTVILRKTDGYPADHNDGIVVYSDPGTVFPDDTLSPHTTYYYRAWSEVTAGSFQQWSDDYKSVLMTTTAYPEVITDNATLVEETTATFNGLVTYDVGEACQYRFIYGTVSGGPYSFSTGWTGSVTIGQSFSAAVTGLHEGTGYYYEAQVKNSYGTVNGAEIHFLTKPLKPENPVVTVEEVNATHITLTWTKGVGAQKTMIRRKTGDFPADRTDGDLVYYDTGTSCIDTGLDPDTVYYYRAWSEVSGSEQWSDDYQDITVLTGDLKPTTTTTTTTTTTSNTTTTSGPVSVGGRVYPVNKAQILAPWLIMVSILITMAGVIFEIARTRKKR